MDESRLRNVTPAEKRSEVDNRSLISSMGDIPVLIAGAGPTGLVMAIELIRAGIPVRLIDRAMQPAQYSQALVVQARTLEQFERYGIAEIAVKQGRKIQSASAVSEGKPIVQFDLTRIPGRYPYILFLPQSRTERILIDYLQELGGTIERGSELISFEDTGQGVELTLRLPDGSTETVRSTWLLGCDGAHSTVRKRLGVSFAGEAVPFTFYLGDLQLEGPDLLGDELRVYLHRGDIVFLGRLTDNVQRVIVALHVGQPEKQVGLEDFQDAFDRMGIKLKAVGADWMTPFRVNERKAGSYRQGHVFLAGDACHVHSPVGGQGMNTGIQDAANLAWKLAAVAAGAPDRLLDSYNEERGQVGDALLDNTSRVLSAATSANPLVEHLRDFFASTFSPLGPVQNQIVRFISETAINYRHSSIVVDRGGDGTLRAGDRVPNPDVTFADGQRGRLLDALQGTQRYLVVAVNVAETEEIRQLLPSATIQALSSDLNTDEVASLFGRKPKVVIVRPDGYAGFRGNPAEIDELKQYARLTALNQRARASAS